MEILDELDRCFTDSGWQGFAAVPDSALLSKRVRTLRSRLEAANSALYRSIRTQMRRDAPADSLRRWMRICQAKGAPRPGLSYDSLDELISGVLQLREPANAPSTPGPEMVFYQPTPVRHILRLIAATKLSASDVLVDLGSGLGHVAILGSILTGARTIGIESHAAYVRSARASARSLGLGRVSFVHQDARNADLSAGTVFYLYTPFTGTILATVVRKLRQEGTRRSIRICSLGPCSLALAAEPWLTTRSVPNADRITCFRPSR